MRRLLVAMLVGVGVSLCGCGTARVAPAVITTDLFSAGEGILKGFDAEGEGVSWEGGDSALFGVVVYEGGRRTVRYVLIEVEPQESTEKTSYMLVSFSLADGVAREYASPLRDIAVHLYDDTGVLLEESRGQIAVALAANGFFDAAEAVSGLEKIEQVADLDRMTVDRWARGLLALMAVMDSINANQGLSPLMMRIVRKPSLASVVLNGGVSITVTPKFEAATREVVEGLDVYRVPLDINANGKLALECVMDASPVRTPRHVSAGVVQATARNPSDPGRWALVRLLAARRVE